MHRLNNFLAMLHLACAIISDEAFMRCGLELATATGYFSWGFAAQLKGVEPGLHVRLKSMPFQKTIHD